MKNQFDPEMVNEQNITYQFKMKSEAGGEWFVTVKENKCIVIRGRSYSPDMNLEMNKIDFVKIINSELDKSSAFKNGKMKMKGDDPKNLHF